MQTFDYVMTLMSFVYALAIAHLLATVGDIIAGWSRVRFSWLNAVWMVFSLLAVLVWWMGMWGLRDARAWNMGTVSVFFALAAILYLEARLVCPRIAHEGQIDLEAFHKEEGWKYMTGFAVITAATILVNVFYFGRGRFTDFTGTICAVLIQCLASIIGALFTARWVQIGVALVIATVWAWYFYAVQGAFT
jgi:hypothetical protein